MHAPLTTSPCAWAAWKHSAFVPSTPPMHTTSSATSYLLWLKFSVLHHRVSRYIIQRAQRYCCVFMFRKWVPRGAHAAFFIVNAGHKDRPPARSVALFFTARLVRQHFHCSRWIGIVLGYSLHYFPRRAAWRAKLLWQQEKIAHEPTLRPSVERCFQWIQHWQSGWIPRRSLLCVLIRRMSHKLTVTVVMVSDIWLHVIWATASFLSTNI